MQKSNPYYYWCLNTCAFFWLNLSANYCKEVNEAIKWMPCWERVIAKDASFITDPTWTQLYFIFQGGLLRFSEVINNLFCLFWCKQKADSINSVESRCYRAHITQAQQQPTGVSVDQTPTSFCLSLNHFTDRQAFSNCLKDFAYIEGKIRKIAEVFLHFKAI